MMDMQAFLREFTQQPHIIREILDALQDKGLSEEEAEKDPTILYGEEINQDVVIARLCSKFGMKLQIKFGFYFVYTNISSWYFNNDGKKIVLHHENFNKHNNGHSWANDYHIQDKISRTQRRL